MRPQRGVHALRDTTTSVVNPAAKRLPAGLSGTRHREPRYNLSLTRRLTIMQPRAIHLVHERSPSRDSRRSYSPLAAQTTPGGGVETTPRRGRSGPILGLFRVASGSPRPCILQDERITLRSPTCSMDVQ